MPLFAVFFGLMVKDLAMFFAKIIGKKMAFGLAMVAAFAGLTITFGVAIASAIGVLGDLPVLPDGVRWGVVYFMPSNLSTCVGAIVAAKGLSAAYAWNVRNMSWLVHS